MSKSALSVFGRVYVHRNSSLYALGIFHKLEATGRQSKILPHIVKRGKPPPFFSPPFKYRMPSNSLCVFCRTLGWHIVALTVMRGMH